MYIPTTLKVGINNHWSLISEQQWINFPIKRQTIWNLKILGISKPINPKKIEAIIKSLPTNKAQGQMVLV